MDALVIDSVGHQHDGDYTVKAQNVSGSVQTSANLSVQAEQSVDFVKKLEDVEIKEMATCKMEVEVDEGQTVKWYKDGEPIIGAPSAAAAPPVPCDMQIENVQKIFTSHFEQEYTPNIQ